MMFSIGALLTLRIPSESIPIREGMNEPLSFQTFQNPIDGRLIHSSTELCDQVNSR